MMDTLFWKKEFSVPYRTLENVLTLLLFITLVTLHSLLQTPVFAMDLLANNSIAVPKLIQTSEHLKQQLSPQFIKDKFEKRIQEKYAGYTARNIEDGIKHIKMTRYYAGKPVKINIIEINRQVASEYEVKPAVASTNTLAAKNTLRTISNRTNAIAAINGGFFKPQTGVPLGTLMIDQKIYTGPIYDRVALGIFDDGYDVARIQLNAEITANNHTIKIDNINQPRMLSSHILIYTRDWGKYAPASPQYGVQLQIEGNEIKAASANPLVIPDNGYVIVGPKSELSKFFGAKYADIQITTHPQWSRVRHIISGGPYLVKDSQVYVDTTAQKLQAIGGRNPRTAIGYTKDNDLILVAVDGREGSSVGMTLTELGYFMKSLGCVNAINLDGGGSTVMQIKGQIVNNPPQIGGIALSNALVISKKL